MLQKRQAFFDAERLRRVGQMLLAVPPVEGRTFGGIGDGGANDEIGCWHCFLRMIFLKRMAKY